MGTALKAARRLSSFLAATWKWGAELAYMHACAVLQYKKNASEARRSWSLVAGPGTHVVLYVARIA
jgi:hypothetical protein